MKSHRKNENLHFDGALVAVTRVPCSRRLYVDKPGERERLGVWGTCVYRVNYQEQPSHQLPLSLLECRPHICRGVYPNLL